MRPTDTQTYALLRRVLPRDLADLAHTYLYVEYAGMHSTTYDIMRCGYYELCVVPGTFDDFGYASWIACNEGYAEIARALISMWRNAGLLPTAFTLNDCIGTACFNNHRNTARVAAEFGATACWACKDIDRHRRDVSHMCAAADSR